MDVFILAAGRGQRMMPLTARTPKPLLDIGGLKLIEIHLLRLQQAGFSRVIVNLAWLGEQIADFLGDGMRYGLDIAYSWERDGALETAGGIRHALALIQSEQFVLVNGDVLTDFPFDRLLPGNLSQTTKPHHLVLVNNPPHHPEGDFWLKNQQIISDPAKQASKHTYAGIARLHTDMFRALAPGKQPLAPLLREAMAAHQVSGEHYCGRWDDIGTPERLQAARTSPAIQAWIAELSAAKS